MRFLVFLLLPLLFLAACGGGDEGEPAAPQLPEGFPADFPIYEGATITAASRISAAQGDIYAIGMETTDAAGDVRSFYGDKLAEAPWEVTNLVDIPEENTVVVEFARRDGGGQSGTLAIQEEQMDGQRTLITISLPAPAVTVTPTPPASLAP